MQVTELQVQRSLQALTHDGPMAATPEAGPAVVPEGLVEQLSSAPAMRGDRLASARKRLETGDQPTAEALAQRMVGRLVCDRLR